MTVLSSATFRAKLLELHVCTVIAGIAAAQCSTKKDYVYAAVGPFSKCCTHALVRLHSSVRAAHADEPQLSESSLL
jgi:hypothetical protein